jgi:hypothetical protein
LCPPITSPYCSVPGRQTMIMMMKSMDQFIEWGLVRKTEVLAEKTCPSAPVPHDVTWIEPGPPH